MDDIAVDFHNTYADCVTIEIKNKCSAEFVKLSVYMSLQSTPNY